MLGTDPSPFSFRNFLWFSLVDIIGVGIVTAWSFAYVAPPIESLKAGFAFAFVVLLFAGLVFAMTMFLQLSWANAACIVAFLAGAMFSLALVPVALISFIDEMPSELRAALLTMDEIPPKLRAALLGR